MIVYACGSGSCVQVYANGYAFVCVLASISLSVAVFLCVHQYAHVRVFSSPCLRVWHIYSFFRGVVLLFLFLCLCLRVCPCFVVLFASVWCATLGVGVRLC